MNQPLFSIVIANYNYGRFLADAIESVLKQEGWEGNGRLVGTNDVELIICDGGSTDNSVEVIKRYVGELPSGIERYDFDDRQSNPSGSFVTYWVSERDGGQSAAFNKGFSHAHGKFLVWLNADDVMMPGGLKAIAQLHRKHPSAEWLTGSGIFADKDLIIQDCGTAHRFSWVRARYGDLMTGIPSSFFTKRLLDSVGGVAEDHHYVMDLDLWMKFFIVGARYRRCKDFIFAFRKHEDSKMSGLDVSSSAVAIDNRNKAHLESVAFLKRYNKTPRMRYWADLLTISVIDKIRTFYMRKRLVGKSVWSLYEKGL